MKNLLIAILCFLSLTAPAQWRPDKNKVSADGQNTLFEVYYDNASEYSVDGAKWHKPNLAGGGFGISLKNTGGTQVFYARVVAVGYLKYSPAPIPPVGVSKPEIPVVTVLEKPVREVEVKAYGVPDPGIGVVGDFYGSNSFALARELDGGIWDFRFYGNAADYPAKRKANDNLVMQRGDLVAIHLPTHSVVCKWGAAPARSTVQMKLYDWTGKLVWELNDTKSGYHPNAFGFGGVAKRGNNHPDDACRWLVKGQYRLWYKNTSDEASLVQDAWWGTARVGTARFMTKVKPGEEIWIDCDMSNLDDRSDSFKINCNYY